MQPAAINRLTWSAAAGLPALLVLLLTGGCSRQLTTPAFWSASREGHVYLAGLMVEHPLYDQYRRLGEEIVSLRRPLSLPTAPPVFLELGELFLPGPEAPVFPLAAFAARKAEWQQSSLPEERPQVAQLDPDLKAEVNWASVQARRRAETGLQLAMSEQERALAEVRAAAVKARQEALNNAGLDLTIPDREAEEAADRERQRLWAQIEEEVARARVACEQRLEASRRQVEEELQQSVEAAEAAAWERMARRTEIIGKSGSETRTRMSKALAAPEAPALEQGLAWRPEDPGGVDIAGGGASLLARERVLRLAQAERLASQRAELARAIESGTELAVRRLAGLEGIRVQFPPMDPASGPDLTEELRAPLRRMFQY